MSKIKILKKRMMSFKSRVFLPRLFFVVLLLFGGLRQAESQLAETAWPMYGHDLRHTWRSSYDGPLKPQLKWKFRLEKRVSPYSSPAIGEDGTVYIGSEDQNLYAISPDGTLRWKFPTGDRVISSPAIAQDGTIYIGSEDFNLYAINPNGTLKWKFATSGRVQSSPSIGPDGIYVGSNDGFLYAIKLDGTLRWKEHNWDISDHLQLLRKMVLSTFARKMRVVHSKLSILTEL